jgi:hypothetical protein
VHAIICEELWPPFTEVALPFAIVVNLDKLLGWPTLHSCRMAYAISWPSIASANWEGRRRRSSAPARPGR